MHFYEASIITTVDGLHCQVYSNEHPVHAILVKPKYIPTDKIECVALPHRFISGKKMNRLDLWIKDKIKLAKYIQDFKKAYPQYILNDQNLVFAIPIEHIERVYFPKRGFKELMTMPKQHLDSHLTKVVKLGEFFLSAGLSIEDLGITYSSLLGHYSDAISDINFIVYGKAKFWSLMNFLDTAKHPLLRWKQNDEWGEFRKKRNREQIFSEEEFIKVMSRKKSEGFFNESLFILFCAENPDEARHKWGSEKYTKIGHVTIRALVKDDHNSVVRPGLYDIEETPVVEQGKTHLVKQVVFYSRDYCMLSRKGEEIEVSGQLEDVETDKGERFSRIVVGYFDSYLDERREKEYIKPILNTVFKKTDKNQEAHQAICEFCQEAQLSIGKKTNYGAVILHKEGTGSQGWFATLSPKTGSNPEKDFTIQIMPLQHIKHIAQVSQDLELAKNQGIIIAKISSAIHAVLLDEKRQNENDENAVRIGIYGKSKHPTEHLHMKIFPWTGSIGQPYTVDSSFEKKETLKDSKTGEEFVKMKPVHKVRLSEARISQLSKKLIEALHEKH